MGTHRRLRRNHRVVRWLLGLTFVALIGGLGVHFMLPVRYTAIVRTAATRNHLDPALVAAVIRVESSYRRTAVSPRGAVGLMQLMPSTATWIRSERGDKDPPSDLTDPRQNIDLGAWYLRYLLARYNDNLVLALAAYNSGPSITDGWIAQGRMHWDAANGADIPYPETRNFVARVLWYQRLYRIVYGI